MARVARHARLEIRGDIRVGNRRNGPSEHGRGGMARRAKRINLVAGFTPRNLGQVPIQRVIVSRRVHRTLELAGLAFVAR